MYFLTAVINNEELFDDIITSLLDIGITGATVFETTDSLQLISHHIPIFAGFRALTSGGMMHNKTLFTVIEDKNMLDQAIAYLETVCRETGKPHQGIYFVIPLSKFGRLGKEIDSILQQQHMEKNRQTP